MTPRVLIPVLVGITALAGTGAFLVRPVEVDRIESPDGAYAVVLTRRLYEGLLPRMPGDGMGMSGWATLVTRDGRRCARVALPMLALADVDWRPEAVEVGFNTRWDLRTCRPDRLAPPETRTSPP